MRRFTHLLFMALTFRMLKPPSKGIYMKRIGRFLLTVLIFALLAGSFISTSVLACTAVSAIAASIVKAIS